MIIQTHRKLLECHRTLEKQVFQKLKNVTNVQYPAILFNRRYLYISIGRLKEGKFFFSGRQNEEIWWCWVWGVFFSSKDSFALPYLETSKKVFPKDLVWFWTTKGSKKWFSRAAIFLPRRNPMGFEKVGHEDWTISRNFFFSKNPIPNFRGLYLDEYWADFSETPPD